MRYFLKLSYNGTEFHGWQIQPNATSIQEEIEKSLSLILRKKTPIVGCGRTDTGVHAREYFAHFESENPLEISLEDLAHKLNTMLHAHISIEFILEVTDEAHARFDATKRSYEYRITSVKNPFKENLAYRFNLSLDVENMNKACLLLLGEQDFGCFCKSKTDNLTDICTIYEARWESDGMELNFHVTANRFLRNMVRAMVGTLLEIGLGKMTLDELSQVIASKDRTKAGRSVPAHGLYLTKVEYPSEIFHSTK